MASEKKRARAANGRSSIFKSRTDGTCHGYVTVGAKDNGRSDRRHVRGKTKDEVTKKVQRLERERDEGKVRNAGQVWTVEQWLNHWLDNIVAPPAISENAHDAYANAVRVHLVPALGGHKPTTLQPEHLERLYRAMVQRGSAPGSAHQVHRIRAALNEAMRRKHITENVATVACAPEARGRGGGALHGGRHRPHPHGCTDGAEQREVGDRARAGAAAGGSARAEVG